jgi:hypothetical protein
VPVGNADGAGGVHGPLDPLNGVAVAAAGVVDVGGDGREATSSVVDGVVPV